MQTPMGCCWQWHFELTLQLEVIEGSNGAGVWLEMVHYGKEDGVHGFGQVLHFWGQGEAADPFCGSSLHVCSSRKCSSGIA